MKRVDTQEERAEETSAIHKSEHNTDICALIIKVIAGALNSDKDHCLEAGMDDYLSKSITLCTAWKYCMEKIECLSRQDDERRGII